MFTPNKSFLNTGPECRLSKADFPPLIKLYHDWAPRELPFYVLFFCSIRPRRELSPSFLVMKDFSISPINQAIDLIAGFILIRSFSAFLCFSRTFTKDSMTTYFKPGMANVPRQSSNSGTRRLIEKMQNK